MEFFTLINILGTISFAASGALAGIKKQLDLFGILVIAFATSVGGGTIRDMLVGHFPVNWVLDPFVVSLVSGTAITTILLRRYVTRLDAALVFFDALGLGFFALRGIEVGDRMGLSAVSCIILGTITGCFGGVLRDILLNDIPRLFRKEIYATACLLGGIIYFILKKTAIPGEWVQWATILVVFGIRTVALRYNISLPNVK